MRRTVVRVVVVLALAGAVLVAVGIAVVDWRWTRRFAAPFPALAASADPAVIAQGQYLVYGAAACAYCHVPRDAWDELDRGAQLPLSGNHLFRLPFGDIYSSNLTPDSSSGIGRRTDGELARILRYGVRADGRAAFPLMEFQLSDEDLVAVVSYLRAQPATPHAVPEHRLSLFGKALMAFAIAPAALEKEPPAASPRAPSVERGAYLAKSVSSCVACHTDRGSDGALIDPPFGGGQRMDVAADASKVYVSPNLTPDPTTSPIGRWTEDVFVTRFQRGAQIPGTPMPWGAYARMTNDDLRSVYRYLRTLPPTVRRTGPPIQAKRGG
jgi:mono/diheme cytochrome c family protein